MGTRYVPVVFPGVASYVFQCSSCIRAHIPCVVSSGGSCENCGKTKTKCSLKPLCLSRKFQKEWSVPPRVYDELERRRLSAPMALKRKGEDPVPRMARKPGVAAPKEDRPEKRKASPISIGMVVGPSGKVKRRRRNSPPAVESPHADGAGSERGSSPASSRSMSAGPVVLAPPVVVAAAIPVAPVVLEAERAASPAVTRLQFPGHRDVLSAVPEEEDRVRVLEKEVEAAKDEIRRLQRSNRYLRLQAADDRRIAEESKWLLLPPCIPLTSLRVAGTRAAFPRLLRGSYGPRYHHG